MPEYTEKEYAEALQNFADRMVAKYGPTRTNVGLDDEGNEIYKDENGVWH